MLFNTPYWLRLLGRKELHWEMPGSGQEIYLTFDDGPNPKTTPLILNMLAQFNARATFFCVGENVLKYPETYQMILDAGHIVGNHTHNHLKGWKTETKKYVENAEKCSRVVKSKLFRPPYGKMNRSQVHALNKRFKIIMWTVLSRDYDVRVDQKSCLEKTWKYTKPGAIIVFHDNIKAIGKLAFVLPEYLGKAVEKGYQFELLK